MDAHARVYGPGSPQQSPSQHLSLLASVSSTDSRNFAQMPVSRSPQPNHTPAPPIALTALPPIVPSVASAAHSPMDARPSTVSTTATATRATTPNANATAQFGTPSDDDIGTAACDPSERASIRASSLPDAAGSSCLSFADAGNALHSFASPHSSSAPVLCQPVESSFPRPFNSIIDYDNDDDAAMETSSEDNTQLPVSATSSQTYDTSGRPAQHHARTLSDSHIEPIRSLTGLALSPHPPHRQSLSLHAQRGHSQRSSSERHAEAVDSSMLRQILVRIDDIQHYCENLVQMQEQQAAQISSLEATIRQHNMASFPHTPATGSAAVPAAGPAAPSQSRAAAIPAPGFPGGEAHKGGAMAGAGAAEQAGSSIPQVTYQHQLHQSQHASEQGATRAERGMHRSPDEPPPPHHQQHQYHYYQPSRSPQRYLHAASHQAVSPTHRHLHQARTAPYSTRTSPVMVPGRAMSPPAVRGARAQRLSAPMAPLNMNETPTARGRRDSAYQAQMAQLGSPAWQAHQQQQHYQQQQQSAHGAMTNTPFTPAALAAAAPAIDERAVHAQAHYASAGSSSQHNMVPHGLSASAFGYAVPGSNATASSASMAEHFQQPMGAAGLAGARMKRARMGESTDELVAAGSGGGAGEGRQSRGSPYYYQQQQQQPLPPIRTGGMVRGVPEQRAPLPRTSSLHLIRPDAVVAARSARVPKDKGKASTGGQAAVADNTGGNPEAQPTSTWLAGQRPYKNALLRLLTLESFYPSDVAMLNVFRNMGDFTNEQIEASAATMLSWARGWLRYNRNAVLRSTLDSKAKASLTQLAEALQHDLHAEANFTAPPNIQRCALLRLIYLKWQRENKLGTKSQSMYRDYETRLRELEALPTDQEREAEWNAIMEEESSLRLALIREGRGSGGAAILPRPDHRQKQQQSPPPASQQQQQQPIPVLAYQQPMRPQTPQQPVLARRQSMEWPSHSGTHTPVPGQAHYTQQMLQREYYRRMGAPAGQPAMSPPQHQHPHRFSHPIQPLQQQELAHAFQAAQGRQNMAHPGQMDVDAWSGAEGARAIGKDDGSETSVDLSPEP
ncbi:hypothetical protein GGF43_001528 [Coemansia sp. RSA 2618]|nr:hypothetical protein GGF43_001528 [Coemansia sp. RSA 2618]